MADLEESLDSANRKRRSYTVTIPGSNGTNLEAKLFLPPKPGTYPAVLLNGGLMMDPHREFTLLGKYLTGLGYGVLIPKYLGHYTDCLVPADANRVVEAFEYLKSLKEVSPDRVGMLGVSYGGLLSLVGAADSRINKDVHYVLSFGGPTNLEELLGFALANPKADTDLRRIVRRSFEEGINDNIEEMILTPREYRDAERLDGLYKDHFIISRLLRSKTEAEVHAFFSEFTTATKEIINRISPIAHTESILARTFFLHGMDDRVIPVEQSSQMYQMLVAEGKESHYVTIDGLGHGVGMSQPLKVLQYLKKEGRNLLDQIQDFMCR